MKKHTRADVQHMKMVRMGRNSTIAHVSAERYASTVPMLSQ